MLLYLSVFINIALVFGKDLKLENAYYFVPLKNTTNFVTICENDIFQCPGTLVKADTIVTVAHCFKMPLEKNKLTLHVLVEQVRCQLPIYQNHAFMKDVMLHNNYQSDKLFKNLFDIAIAYLDRPFTLTPTIQPMKVLSRIQFKNAWLDVLMSHKTCRVYSWTMKAPHRSLEEMLMEKDKWYPIVSYLEVSPSWANCKWEGHCLKPVGKEKLQYTDSGAPLICGDYNFGFYLGSNNTFILFDHFTRDFVLGPDNKPYSARRRAHYGSNSARISTTFHFLFLILTVAHTS